MNQMLIRARKSVFLATGISLLAMTSALAGEVTVWSWDPNFNGATMKEAAARYSASHPDMTINLVDFAKADLEQKLQAQLASGTTEGLPDIVLIEDYGAQKYLLSFPGAFEPLNGKIDYSGFAPYKVELATVDGNTYSMPFDSGVTGLFYRTDILAEAGYSAADLQDIDWDQFIEIATVVKEKTGHPMLGVDLNDAGALRILLQSMGGWYFTADGQPALAITDLSNLFGAVKFYKACRGKGVKPIIGADIFLEPEQAVPGSTPPRWPPGPACTPVKLQHACRCRHRPRPRHRAHCALPNAPRLRPQQPGLGPLDR